MSSRRLFGAERDGGLPNFKTGHEGGASKHYPRPRCQHPRLPPNSANPAWSLLVNGRLKRIRLPLQRNPARPAPNVLGSLAVKPGGRRGLGVTTPPARLEKSGGGRGLRRTPGRTVPTTATCCRSDRYKRVRPNFRAPSFEGQKDVQVNECFGREPGSLPIAYALMLS
jgi:hypothetical protein